MSRHGRDRGGHLGDGGVGGGDDQHVDPRGGAGEVVAAAQKAGERAAARRERRGQGRPARPGPISRTVVTGTSSALQPLTGAGRLQAIGSVASSLPTRSTSPPEAPSCRRDQIGGQIGQRARPRTGAPTCGGGARPGRLVVDQLAPPAGRRRRGCGGPSAPCAPGRPPPRGPGSARAAAGAGRRCRARPPCSGTGPGPAGPPTGSVS